MNLYSSDHTVSNVPLKDQLSLISEELEKYGVCIIPSLLDDDECSHLETECWKMLEEITVNWETPIKQDDPKTWNLTKFYALHHMLIQQLVSHSQMCWSARQNPKIVEVFRHLWKTQDLVTSFDGISVHFPPEKSGIKKDWYNPKLQKSWIHCDQSYKRNSLECYQSWVTPLAVNPGDATLVYYEGSHKFHDTFAKAMGETPSEDWYVLKADDIQKYESYGCQKKMVTCPKGSMVIWDSRTIHCGLEPQKERLNPNMRICIYVCMVPRSRCTDAVLKKRRKYFEENRTTKHNPAFSNVFSKFPRIRSEKERREYIETTSYPTKAILTDLGKSLI